MPVADNERDLGLLNSADYLLSTEIGWRLVLAERLAIDQQPVDV